MRFLAVALVLSICGIAAAQPEPSTKPAAGLPGDSLMGEMRVQTMKAVTYLHIDSQLTLMTMGPTIEPTVLKLMESIKTAHIMPTGPLMLVYHGVSANPNKKFTLEIGIPVDDAAEPPAGLKKTRSEPFKCATMLYSGPVTKLGQAHQQLYADLFGDGLAPIGTTREYYLYFEDIASANNVILIQVGVQ